MSVALISYESYLTYIDWLTSPLKCITIVYIIAIRGVTMFRVMLNTNNLEKAMLRNNLNYSGLAKAVGVSRSHFSKIVHGQYEPSPFFRQQLLDYFKGCKFDDLFTIEEITDDERVRV